MNRVVDHTTGSGRAAFALFVAVALTAPGSRAGDVSSPTSVGSLNDSEVPLCMAQRIPSLPSPECGQDKVATEGKTTSNQHAYLVLPLILKTDNTENRLKTQNVSCRETNVSSVHEKERFSVLTSTSLISAHLCRRLTLLGAKPSGTS